MVGVGCVVYMQWPAQFIFRLETSVIQSRPENISLGLEFSRITSCEGLFCFAKIHDGARARRLMTAKTYTAGPRLSGLIWTGRSFHPV